MSEDVVYLDNAATTKPFKDVIEEMSKYFEFEFYNPSSVYSCAQNVKKSIENSRELIARTLNADSVKEIFFTSCGSESNTWAILGIVEKYKSKGNHIITSSIEHHSVLNSMKYLEKKGFRITYLDVDENGFINVNDLEKNITAETILVSIMYANNEIGTIEPIEEIGRICRKHDVIFHTDAVQAYGHIKIDVNKGDIDLLSASGHKFGGPKGVGFLYKNKNVQINSFVHGGDQEFSKRAGTENVSGIIGMAKAAEISHGSLEQNTRYETELRDYCIARILNEIPYTRLNGDREKRLSNNINISFQFIEGESLILSLNRFGICASTGSACTSSLLEPSHVLLAIGLSHEIAHGSLRLTINSCNTKEQIDFTIDKIKGVVANLRRMSPLYEDFIKNTY